jgi:hypothetical protein
MKTIFVTVEIKVDEENIETLYPDFPIHYENVEAFLEDMLDRIETEGPDTLNLLGYSIKIKDKTSLPLLYSLN